MSFVYRPVVTRKKDGRKTRTKAKYYWASYVDAIGQTVRKPIRLSNGMRVTRKDVAVQRLRELESLAEREAAGLYDPTIQQAATPIAEALPKFYGFLERNNRAASYLRVVRSVLPRWLADAGCQTIGSISQEAIGKVIDVRLAKGATASSLNSQLGIVKSFTKWLTVHERLLPENRLASMPNVSTAPNKRKRRALTTDEVQRLLAKCSPDRKLYYLIAIYTGLRVNEIRQLTWGDYQQEPPRFELRAETTKSKRSDVIPLHPILVRELTGKRQNSPERICTVPDLRTVLADCEEADIPVLNDRGESIDRHALRKTFVTWLSKHGASPRETQALARHSDINLTMKTYTDEQLLKLSDAVNKLPSV